MATSFTSFSSVVFVVIFLINSLFPECLRKASVFFCLEDFPLLKSRRYSAVAQLGCCPFSTRLPRGAFSSFSTLLFRFCAVRGGAEPPRFFPWDWYTAIFSAFPILRVYAHSLGSPLSTIFRGSKFFFSVEVLYLFPLGCCMFFFRVEGRDRK